MILISNPQIQAYKWIIGNNKAYVKVLNYISYSTFILIVMCMVLFIMEFASQESKIHKSDWARL